MKKFKQIRTLCEEWKKQTHQFCSILIFPGAYDTTRLLRKRVFMSLIIATPHFNAHDRTQYYNKAEDRRGSHLLDQFEEIVILNDPYSLTRQPRRVGERVMASGITFCFQDLIPFGQWKVVSDLSSDHNYILIDIAIVSPIPKKSTRTLLNIERLTGKASPPRWMKHQLPSTPRVMERWTRRLEGSMRSFQAPARATYQLALSASMCPCIQGRPSC